MGHGQKVTGSFKSKCDINPRIACSIIIPLPDLTKYERTEGELDS